VPSLDALIDSAADILAVVTNPDRPAGRGLHHRPSPVKQKATRAGMCVYQPPRPGGPEARDWLRRLAPDVAVVVAYGKILPQALLDVPPLGFVNVHFSLLPLYRGAAPVQRAIMDGVTTTGVSIMVLTAGMDEGPVLASRHAAIAPDDNAGTLGSRLAHLGAELLVPTLDRYAAGELVPTEQDHSRATYAPRLTSADARIDWSKPAPVIRDFIRGLNPDPVAWTQFRGVRVRVLATQIAADPPPLTPGEVAMDAELMAGTGDGVLSLTEVQPAGKRALAGVDWGRGLRLTPGERFE
jgi:methionyl-tRNA formyltransferase